MLLHNVQNLNTFRLKYKYRPFKDYKLETWITTAIFRKVQNLNLCLHYETILPRCLMTCKTLVDIRLWGCAFDLFSLTSVHLPSLKKLHLHTLTFMTDETFSCLISGCPVLEELLIDKFKEDEDDLVCLRISSPTLKWLNITFSYYSGDNMYVYMLELNTPALEYLKLDGLVSQNILVPVLTSLIEADIYFNNDYDFVYEDVFYASLLGFIHKLQHVKSLKLSFRYLEGLEDSALSASTVRFHNLTKLQLLGDWRLISKFIENVENLEVLIIDEFGYHSVHIDFKCWLEARQVPICLSSHLTTIKIRCYRYSKSQNEIVRYILRNALVLKRMEIYIQQGFDEARKFFQQISLIPRGSATCEVAFYPSGNYPFK